MLTANLAQTVDAYHRSIDAFVNGDAGPEKELWSRLDDASLANPLGPPAVGWTEIERALERAASLASQAAPVRFERITEHAAADLAFIVEIERARFRIDGADEITPVALRATTIFRLEAGAWKIVHRHADPITAPRPPESIAER